VFVDSPCNFRWTPFVTISKPASGASLAASLTPARRAQFLAAMPGLKERAKTLLELIEGARFILSARPIQVDDKAAILLTPDARALMGKLAAELRTVGQWDAPSTEQVVRAFAESRDMKLGAVAQPLRAALTGRVTSPPIFDVLAVLGQDESLGRLRDVAALERLPSA
jgi:glutamyl-tRNA synthetase